MKFRRPRSLNQLILIGFGLVAAPLLLAVIWALFNLDRLAEQSEELVGTGVNAAEQSRLLLEQLGSLERLARQYAVLQNADSRELLSQDLQSLQARLDTIAPLASLAGAGAGRLVGRVGDEATSITTALLEAAGDGSATAAAVARFPDLRRDVMQLTVRVEGHIDTELNELQDNIRQAQQISAWQTAALVPGTIVLVLFFTLLVARPIRQIDKAINQLGQSGFSKPIEIHGPTDLEKLGQQLNWLRLRLLELAQEKNRFLRHMSHELKTPLANIREGTELLLDGTVGELQPAQHEVTDILRLNGLKLQQLIENLLSFSAWQTKNEVLTRSEFPIRALAVSVAKAQRLALKALQIQLRLDVDDDIINADRDKIRTVLDNLLSNAVKFSPKGGIITIRGKRREKEYVLEFGDSGPGIPEEERPRIFEAFFQGRQKQGGSVDGTGIGLSVVLECVQAHDGTVAVLDGDEFSGAHFIIRIPQAQIAAQTRMAVNG